jgi:hypothetical protein
MSVFLFACLESIIIARGVHNDQFRTVDQSTVYSYGELHVLWVCFTTKHMYTGYMSKEQLMNRQRTEILIPKSIAEAS